MEEIDSIWGTLTKNGFKISIDTRKDIGGSVFFGIKGVDEDDDRFAHIAMEKGAARVVTGSALAKLQKLARRYRDTFEIPIIVIGGSNGKTTTRELVKCVLETRYKSTTTKDNLNNHIGVPLSIFALDRGAEMGIFEIGANHLGEHTSLLEILNPTHVLVTNNGLDHLEGFGSPTGVEEANGEIISWARAHNAEIIERKDFGLEVTTPLPLTVSLGGITYSTNMVGEYNVENINMALSVGEVFGVKVEKGLESITHYSPASRRSELVEKDGMRLIMDCYNANPTSMMMALESLVRSGVPPTGVILGDMLELGEYAGAEHTRIVEFVSKQNFDYAVFIGKHFKQAIDKKGFDFLWFPDSLAAREWFERQDFTGFTLLLKGSRGIGVEQVVE